MVMVRLSLTDFSTFSSSCAHCAGLAREICYAASLSVASHCLPGDRLIPASSHGHAPIPSVWRWRGEEKPFLTPSLSKPGRGSGKGVTNSDHFTVRRAGPGTERIQENKTRRYISFRRPPSTNTPTLLLAPSTASSTSSSSIGSNRMAVLRVQTGKESLPPPQHWQPLADVFLPHVSYQPSGTPTSIDDEGRYRTKLESTHEGRKASSVRPIGPPRRFESCLERPSLYLKPSRSLSDGSALCVIGIF